jgi:hypothetical protein
LLTNGGGVQLGDEKKSHGSVSQQPRVSEDNMATATKAGFRISGSSIARVSNAQLDRVKAYHEATGVPISRVIDDAIDLYMSSIGEMRLEVLTSKDQQRRNA